MNRRELLQYITLGVLAHPMVLNANVSEPYTKTLVLVELRGGNDGLNTVIPYSNPCYYKLRPKIAIKKENVLRLNDEIGFHPSMTHMYDMFQKGELSILQGLGYENPNRSHFRSIDIWETASNSDEYLEKGWLADVLGKPIFEHNTIHGVVLGGEMGPLDGVKKSIKIANLKHFLANTKYIRSLKEEDSVNNDALAHVLDIQNEIFISSELLKEHLQQDLKLQGFGKGNFNTQMKLATRLIVSGANIPVIKVTLGGFDTHINQPNKHKNLLFQLSSQIDAMRSNLKKYKKWDNITLMTYSEFGRRVAENGSKGSDHGTAAPHFIIGGDVKGGIYGAHPSLEALDKNGDLIYTTDFRTLYKSIAKEWFETSSMQLQLFPHYAPFENLKILD